METSVAPSKLSEFRFNDSFISFGLISSVQADIHYLNLIQFIKNSCVTTPKKKQQTRRLLSQLDETYGKFDNVNPARADLV